ncbi:hypothetical protein [Candidatus Symbiothrix dinenymphae]|nr:hypothetical protein [Candidatus Symbiothrix dinenymphae]
MMSFANPFAHPTRRDYSSVEMECLPPFLHPVGMQHHPQTVASLRDAGWR